VVSRYPDPNPPGSGSIVTGLKDPGRVSTAGLSHKTVRRLKVPEYLPEQPGRGGSRGTSLEITGSLVGSSPRLSHAVSRYPDYDSAGYGTLKVQLAEGTAQGSCRQSKQLPGS